MQFRPIQHCAVVRLRFKCPQRWDALQETADDRVRVCHECQRHVHLCHDRQEAAQRIQQGHCIAAARWVVDPDAVDRSIARMLPEDTSRRHGMIPVLRHGPTLVLAMSDPSSQYALDEARFITGYNIEVIEASLEEITQAIDEAFAPELVEMGVGIFDPNSPGDDSEDEDDPDGDLVDDEEPPSPDSVPGRLVWLILRNAHRSEASQIVFEDTGSIVIIRREIRGTWEEIARPPRKLKAALFRLLAHLSGATPGHEGSLRLQTEGLHLAYRVRVEGEQVGLWPLKEG